MNKFLLIVLLITPIVSLANDIDKPNDSVDAYNKRIESMANGDNIRALLQDMPNNEHSLEKKQANNLNQYSNIYDYTSKTQVINNSGYLSGSMQNDSFQLNDSNILFKAKQTDSVVFIDARNKTPGELSMFLASAKGMGVDVKVINNGNFGEVNRNNMIINHYDATQVLTPRDSAKSRAQQMREKAQNRHKKFNKNN